MKIKYYKCADCGKNLGLHSDWLKCKFFYRMHGKDYLCYECMEARKPNVSEKFAVMYEKDKIFRHG